MIALIISLCSGAIVYAVSVMYAGIGETFSERAGIMNLGVEGVMLMGAVSGYITAVHTQNLFLSFLVVLLTGAALGLAFAFLTVTLQSDQTVCGMAMLIFGTGLSGFIGKDVSGVAANLKFEKIAIPVLSKIPVLGDIFFKQNLLTYAMYFIIPLSMFYIYRTRFGLKLRALGGKSGSTGRSGRKCICDALWLYHLRMHDDVDQRGVRFAGKYKLLEQRNDSRKRLDRICTGCIFILESGHADVGSIALRIYQLSRK